MLKLIDNINVTHDNLEEFYQVSLFSCCLGVFQENNIKTRTRCGVYCTANLQSFQPSLSLNLQEVQSLSALYWFFLVTGVVLSIGNTYQVVLDSGQTYYDMRVVLPVGFAVFEMGRRRALCNFYILSSSQLTTLLQEALTVIAKLQNLQANLSKPIYTSVYIRGPLLIWVHLI